MKKKFISLLLVAAFVLSFVGCGDKDAANNKTSETVKTESKPSETAKTESKAEEKEEAKEPVVLRIFLSDTVGTDDAKVSEYISSLPSVQELGVTVEITRIAPAEYNEKIPLMIASDEQMDIGYDSYDTYFERIKQQAYADLTPYLEADSTLYNQIPESFWTGSVVDGGVWGVPIWKDNGTQWAIFARTEVLEKLNIDPSTLTSLKDTEPIVAATTEAGESGLMVLARHTKYLIDVELFKKYDLFSERLVAIDREEGISFVNTYATEEFKELCALMKDWNQKGYIANDALTRENKNGYYEQGYGIEVIGYAPYAEINTSVARGVDLSAIFTSPSVADSSFRQGSLCVYRKSENQELAFKFIQLMNTDPEVKNAFVYGIPGDHYNLVNGQVELTEGAKDRWTNLNYKTGDMRIAYTLAEDPIDKWDVYQQFNDSAILSVCHGMNFDTSAVSDQIASCNAVIAEYQAPLLLGLVEDYEESIATLVSQLEAAGINDIVAEYQKQYDAQKVVK